jgi:hypothetical protein
MNTEDFLEDQVHMMGTELEAAYREIERLERRVTELESEVWFATEGRTTV